MLRFYNDVKLSEEIYPWDSELHAPIGTWKY